MNILVTRHDKIGDFITILPLCKILKQSGHKVTVLVSKINVDLAKRLDFIDDVIEYIDDEVSLLKAIAPKKFDASISGYIEFKLGLCLFLTKIPKRIAPATKLAQIFFNQKVKQRRSQVKMTEWQYNLELAKKLNPNIDINFDTPLLNLETKKENFIIFHPGFGGSSDGNLTLDEYLSLAKKASEYTKIVFSFGPDDGESKKYIKENLNFKATIRDDFKSIWDFTLFIATSKLFVSTSTGPMHLAGLTNTATLSFFGDSLFASSKRWSTISDKTIQNNFEIPHEHNEIFQKIENRLLEIIK
jgi:ADP-heptose:LPS heptosyltransferase